MRGTRTILTAAALATTLGAWPASPAHADQFCYGVWVNGTGLPFCGEVEFRADCRVDTHKPPMVPVEVTTSICIPAI